MKIIGMIDIGAFPDYNDNEFYEIKDNYAIIDYGYTANVYEDIYLNLGGEHQAKAFLSYIEENEHGVFVGDGYIIKF